jgi:YHS domain-containing protein
MSSILLRLFILLAVLWLVRRILGMILGEPRKRVQPQGSPQRNVNARMVKDPVCGMYMDPRLALSHEGRGGPFFFCSDDCRRKFIDQPQEYSPAKSVLKTPG